MSGMAELGASWSGNGSGVGGSRIAVGMVIIPLSHAMASGQLLMILLILASVWST